MKFLLAALLALAASIAAAQQLDAKFSCSVARNEDGEQAILADSGEMKLSGERIDAFRWESALFRSTHGFDCSVDTSDGLHAERLPNTENGWRVELDDPRAARIRRGYDFEFGRRCSIRLLRDGDTLHIVPSCPAMCGSRKNFSALSVDLKTGGCRYDE